METAVSVQTFHTVCLRQQLDDDQWLVEALLFRERALFGGSPDMLQRRLGIHLAKQVADYAPQELINFGMATVPQVRKVTVEWEKAADCRLWTRPLQLEFDVLVWKHEAGMHVAHVPALNVDVLATSAAQLDRSLPVQMRIALRRLKCAESLAAVFEVQRCRLVSLKSMAFKAAIPEFRQRLGEPEPGAEKPELLPQVATNLAEEEYGPVFCMERTVDALAAALHGATPRSVLLVGPSGVGKTASVHELVRRRRDCQLEKTQFWSTSGSRLSAGMTGFGMWQQRCVDLCAEAARFQAVLHLGNLAELLEVGRSECVGQGVGSFLAPYIARGELLAIAECTVEQIRAVEQQDPRLLTAFLQIPVAEPGLAEGREILRRCCPMPDDALATLDWLHRRFATYSVYPGRPLRFIRNLLQHRDSESPATANEVLHAFCQETGLPRQLIDDAVPLDVAAAESWFARRVIGQAGAVQLVSELLAVIKTGLSRPGKPLASLLFIGPTGVGKTEMAKAIAEFVFSGRNRMVRFDMSEYNTPDAVNRLIGGVFGAQGTLTSRVRHEPFGVLLFDEFEKAHPWFFDLLLQVLGEGRLTDAGGRLADFRNCIVIMTSNLGAESAHRASVGFASARSEAARQAKHFEEKVRQFLRPELYNRIDRIVPFAPLDEETIGSISRRELDLVTSRDGILYRDLRLDIGSEAAAWLARKGYDERLGARPLKRAVEQELLLPLAEALNTRSAQLRLRASVAVADDNLRVSAEVLGVKAEEAQESERKASLAAAAVVLRRRMQAIDRSVALHELQTELFRIEQRQKRRDKRRKTVAGPAVDMARYAALVSLRDNVNRTRHAVQDAEDEAHLLLFGKSILTCREAAGDLEQCGVHLRALLEELHVVHAGDVNRLTLALFGDSPACLQMMASLYEAYCAQQQFCMRRRMLQRVAGRRAVTVRTLAEGDRFSAVSNRDTAGYLADISGRMARLLLGRESGRHTLVQSDRVKYTCVVQTESCTLEKFEIPDEIHERTYAAGKPERRSYRVGDRVMDDAALDKRFVWSGQDMVSALARALKENYERELDRLLEEPEG